MMECWSIGILEGDPPLPRLCRGIPSEEGIQPALAVWLGHPQHQSRSAALGTRCRARLSAFAEASADQPWLAPSHVMRRASGGLPVRRGGRLPPRGEGMRVKNGASDGMPYVVCWSVRVFRPVTELHELCFQFDVQAGEFIAGQSSMCSVVCVPWRDICDMPIKRP
jgi:hypothetical protein